MRTATRFPLQRFAAIDRAIRGGRYPNAGELAEALEVSRRTVQRDIEFLRDRMGAPIEFDPGRNGYRYSDPGYRYGQAELSEGELVAVFLAERVIREYRGAPFAADLARAFRKMTAGLADRVTVDLDDLASAFSVRETPAPESEPLLLRDLAAAIRGRRRVRLRYWSASRDAETTREVAPYHLTALEAAWYLIADCALRGDVRIFAASRIRSVEVLDATYRLPADFDAAGYLADAFGLMRGVDGERHRVRLRFTGEAVRYVRERTWHPSQRTEPGDDGSLTVTFDLGHLCEVERWALSWGGDVEVLEPDALRARVKAHLEVALARHV